MGVATKYKPGSMALIFKTIFLLFIFISFFGCAPTVIETTKKTTKDDAVIKEETKEEAIVVAGVGQHQMWVAQYYKFDSS